MMWEVRGPVRGIGIGKRKYGERELQRTFQHTDLMRSREKYQFAENEYRRMRSEKRVDNVCKETIGGRVTRNLLTSKEVP